jgi:hypothetical protein
MQKESLKRMKMWHDMIDMHKEYLVWRNKVGLGSLKNFIY